MPVASCPLPVTPVALPVYPVFSQRLARVPLSAVRGAEAPQPITARLSDDSSVAGQIRKRRVPRAGLNLPAPRASFPVPPSAAPGPPSVLGVPSSPSQSLLLRLSPLPDHSHSIPSPQSTPRPPSSLPVPSQHSPTPSHLFKCRPSLPPIPLNVAQALPPYLPFHRHLIPVCPRSLPVPPSVSISLWPWSSQPGPGRLLCSVMVFYPAEIQVRWFQGQQELSEHVVATDVVPNGDLTYQLLVLLETPPRHGVSYTCQVEHVSLEQPLSQHGESHQPELGPGWKLPVTKAHPLGPINSNPESDPWDSPGPQQLQQ
uniref:Ig-like domain-containing protein n=1 Tax=Catharus ustulatus TaxID=91951 RepID=A0A8C3VFL2_CATUS